MRPLGIHSYHVFDRRELVTIGYCPICGKELRKTAKGADEVCCDRYIDWDKGYSLGVNDG